MSDVSRRQFLRHAGIGAAAAGLAAASGGVIFSSLDAGASTVASPPGVQTTDVPTAAKTDIFAHVSDLAAGKVTVFHGTEAFTVTDPALARALARVTQ